MEYQTNEQIESVGDRETTIQVRKRKTKKIINGETMKRKGC